MSPNPNSGRGNRIAGNDPRRFVFDQLAAIEYADIVLRRDRIGNPISMPDAQIAVICRVSSAGLATRNGKDFEYTGLVLINSWEA